MPISLAESSDVLLQGFAALEKKCVVCCCFQSPWSRKAYTISPFRIIMSYLQTIVAGKCPSSAEDDQEKQRRVKKNFSPCTKVIQRR
ncbi:hypothetical protein TNCV_4395051 [Trichonephila clavipes]|uniref:Uncharacterized protein n=1 Tax=Trichonephila clavipes TaxID=2585209 RepID=A0A8X7BDT6_TRICX|nr:hypothetical protein TNCV_4395051 [Trichonephila clavipes]